MSYRGKPIIGLTGGIGSGKSTVAGILRSLGCYVTDSDALARAALEQPEIRSKLVERWGDDIVGENGFVDRRAIGAIVFGNEVERKWLESMTHPWIEARRKEQFDAAPAETVAFVIDAPLLVEAGLDEQCDAVIFVDAPVEMRRKRVRDGRGWDETELDRRERAQLPLDLKRKKADHVVVNDTTESELTGAIRHVLNCVLQSSRS